MRLFKVLFHSLKLRVVTNFQFLFNFFSLRVHSILTILALFLKRFKFLLQTIHFLILPIFDLSHDFQVKFDIFDILRLESFNVDRVVQLHDLRVKTSLQTEHFRNNPVNCGLFIIILVTISRLILTTISTTFILTISIQIILLVVTCRGGWIRNEVRIFFKLLLDEIFCIKKTLTKLLETLIKIGRQLFSPQFRFDLSLQILTSLL